MEKIFTCYDAVWILKNLTILNIMKEYNINIITYRKEDITSKVFLIKLEENDLFNQAHFEVNTAKNLITEISEEKFLSEKEKEKFVEYKTTIVRNRSKEFVE